MLESMVEHFWPSLAEVLGADIPWKKIGKEVASQIGTPRDISAWFKNILLMSFLLRRERGASHSCMACAEENEDWDHFWRCKAFRPTWRKFTHLANRLHEEEDSEHNYSPHLFYLGVKKNKDNQKGSLR